MCIRDSYRVSAVDTCGNSSTQDVPVKVDGTGPVITVQPLASCYPSEAAALADLQSKSSGTDVCDGAIVPTVTLLSGAGTCAVTYRVSASDTCGNTSTQDVPVKVDGTGPVLTVQPPASCYPSEAAALADLQSKSSATDNCDGALTPTVTLLSGAGTCAVTYRVSAVDTCGNSSTQDVPVKVDGTGPVLTVQPLASCYPSEAAALADLQSKSSATDNCDGALTPTVTLLSGAGTCAVTYRVSASDTCGNTSTQDVPVKVDGTGPVLTVQPPASCY